MITSLGRLPEKPLPRMRGLQEELAACAAWWSSAAFGFDRRRSFGRRATFRRFSPLISLNLETLSSPTRWTCRPTKPRSGASISFQYVLAITRVNAGLPLFYFT